MTIDDPDIKPYLEVSDQECNKENIVNEEVSFNERKHSHKVNVEVHCMYMYCTCIVVHVHVIIMKL